MRGNDRGDHAIRFDLDTLQRFAFWFQHTNIHAFTAEKLAPSSIMHFGKW